MFGRLRLQLTSLYLGVAVLLVLGLSVATYALVSFYFENATDLAMQRKMAQEFRSLGLSIPSELAEAESISGPATGTSANAIATSAPTQPDDHHDDEESHDGDKPPPSSSSSSSSTHRNPENDVELAAISPLYLDANGLTIVSASLTAAPNFAPYTAALEIARTQGHDHRTITVASGERQRILTYWLNPASATQPAYIQLTRLLADQDQIRNRLLLGLLVLGLICIMILGALSWWLANRAIKPAQRAWEQQRQFVANASHELRTPLTLLRANAETLQQNFADVAQATSAPARIDIDDSQALLQNILDACDHTDRLVGDLLLLSRLDAGQLAFEQVALGAEALLHDLARQVRPLADGHAVAIEIGPASGIVRADLTRLRQVLLILIDNALRHTPAHGHITLSAQPQGHAVQISVKDTGSGIPPEHLARVFERFYQVDPAHSHKANAGLGLSIAKALVEGMHGHITITSTVGNGTQVTLSLPAQD